RARHTRRPPFRSDIRAFEWTGTEHHLAENDSACTVRTRRGTRLCDQVRSDALVTRGGHHSAAISALSSGPAPSITLPRMTPRALSVLGEAHAFAIRSDLTRSSHEAATIPQRYPRFRVDRHRASPCRE